MDSLINSSYSYGPYVWPSLLSAVLASALGVYSWRRLKVPGALPFAIASMFGALWITGLTLESAAMEPSGKVFWFAFQGVWQVPLAIAITCFLVQYAGLGRWLTRRNLILMAIPALAVLALILTNGLHHLMWRGFQVDQTVKPIRSEAYWIGFGYAYALALINIVILVWLFIRSPRQRWPAVFMLVGQIGARALYVMDTVSINFLEPLSAIFFMFVFMFSIYAFVLFRFHVFDPAPLARDAVLEQMSEGMLVFDLRGRIVSLNPMAERILGKPAAALRGRAATELLPIDSHLLEQTDKTALNQSEITLGTGNAARHYSLNLTPLRDRRGEVLGRLLLLHDVTEQKRVQMQVLEQQRVVATLQERERLARELHDGIGQVLGYVAMQAQTAQKWVQEGNTRKAEVLLGRLAEIARDAHADVRESILNLKIGSVPDWSFVPALRQYLDSFQANYGIRAELSLSEPMGEKTFGPDAGVQLMRVIQEALTNARKHSGASTVRVAIDLKDGAAHIAISDDGSGFDTGRLTTETGTHCGLSFMRERMAQIQGSVWIESRPARGTVVNLDVPVRGSLREKQHEGVTSR